MDRVAFGDVVHQVRDRVDPGNTDLERYVAGEHMYTDDLRIRRWGLIGNGYLGPAFHMRFKPGHVLYGSRRTYLRKVAVADFEGITANTTFVIEAKDPKVLLPELLPFIMQTESFHEHSIKQSKGSVNPYINFSDLKWYEFALPPLEEQARIAEVLEATRGLIESLRFALGAMDMLGLALGADILSHNTGSGCRMAEIARFRSGDGIVVSQLPKSQSTENPVPVLGGNGVAGYTSVPMNSVPVPTIVIGRVGEYCGAVHFVREPAWISDNALFMCELHKSVDPRYLALCLTALRLNRLRSGGAQPLVNQQILGNLLIPLPSLTVQMVFVEQHETITASRNATAQRMAHAQELAAIALKMMEGMQ